METNNVAAMREALIETQSAIARVMDILNKIPDTCGYGGLLDDAADELCALREWQLKDALSAPPRNCDKFGGDEEKLFDCYIQERKASKYKDLFYDYGFWLLKTAKTKGAVE